jgi:hypothetical protein
MSPVVLTASQMNASGISQENRWFIITYLLNHCFRLAHFPQTWKDAKIILSKQGLQIPSKFMPDKHSVHDGQIIREGYFTNSPKAR